MSPRGTRHGFDHNHNERCKMQSTPAPSRVPLRAASGAVAPSAAIAPTTSAPAPVPQQTTYDGDDDNVVTCPWLFVWTNDYGDTVKYGSDRKR